MTNLNRVHSAEGNNHILDKFYMMTYYITYDLNHDVLCVRAVMFIEFLLKGNVVLLCHRLDAAISSVDPRSDPCLKHGHNHR